MTVCAKYLSPLMFVALLVPRSAAAQDVEERGRQFGTTPPPGYYEMRSQHPRAFQFSEDQGWARRARSIASRRQQLRGQLLVSGESVPMQAQVDVNGVLTGDLNVPVFLILYANTDSAAVETFAPQSTMQSRLYGTDPAPPYSVHTYYRELSNDQLNVNGTVFHWSRVVGDDTFYEGDCNGLCNDGNVATLIVNTVALHDDSVEFGQFDNDGPDGIPNSGDDDGYIDALVLLHPEMGGECGNSNIWAHRFTYQSWGGTNDETNDPAAGGGNIRFRDYIIQGAEGGDGGCVPSQPAAIGTISHETGHVFGLPDLYDTSGSGTGIGRWGLMSSGNQQAYFRPAHMSAWSKAELGWVTEVLIQRDTVLEISPVVTSDTTYILPTQNSNQYFILENRQKIGSDSMLIEEGLLIWHIDSVQVQARLSSNTVNAFQPYAVALEQADGLEELEAGTNRGDADDPFPGNTSNASFGRQTSPSSLLNFDNGPTFVEIDSVTQLASFGPIRVRIGFERSALISASDTNVAFRLDGVDHNVYRDFLTSGREYQLDMDAVQFQDNGRRRYTWVSWSDGQARTHTFIASDVGDTITASIDAEFQLQATVTGTGGSIAADAPIDLANGELLPQDSVVTLVATVDSAGHVFEGWLGSDTATTNDTLMLTMHQPFTVDAFFAAPLAVVVVTLPGATMGAPYSDLLTAVGGTGAFLWRATGGSLPDGLALDSTGVVSGLPRETGDFVLNIEVESGSQTVVDSLNISVVAPVLAVASVVQHLAGDGESLAETDEVYLDLVGNQNNRVDVGDFLAWIQVTGGTVTAAEMAAVLEAAGQRGIRREEKR